MANFADLANRTARLILLYLKNIALTSYRWTLILIQYLGIYWQKKRLNKLCQRLGRSVYTNLTAGDVNPLLQDEVKDLMGSLQGVNENINARREAISQLRQEIKATSYRLPQQPPAPEPKPEEPVSEEPR
ncbi:MAG: hypothetical protein FJ135_04750 [Deltaproteobacteria bacterium]|nr:hypothetical protein [Deltaproteobacteria bacterium]